MPRAITTMAMKKMGSESTTTPAVITHEPATIPTISACSMIDGWMRLTTKRMARHTMTLTPWYNAVRMMPVILLRPMNCETNVRSSAFSTDSMPLCMKTPTRKTPMITHMRTVPCGTGRPSSCTPSPEPLGSSLTCRHLQPPAMAMPAYRKDIIRQKAPTMTYTHPT